MTKTKRYFIEITCLNNVSDDRVFLALKKNIPNSFIKLFSMGNVIRGDIK